MMPNTEREEEAGLSPGKIKFYDNFLPTLDAGRYTVTLTQKVKLGGADGDPSFVDERTFLVDSQRWRLGPQDVHAVYPPPYSEGDYAQTLPHIVLRRRTIPWERSLGETTVTIDDDVQETYARPWVALLLFTSEELAGEKPVTRPINNLATTADASDEPAAAGKKVLLPNIELSEAEEAEIPTEEETSDASLPVPVTQTIDVNAGRFFRIAPHLDDLPFLAHVRQVNTGAKEILGLQADGWFSVVIGNRLPNADEAVPRRHIAHLVSLDGWGNRLAEGARNVPNNITHLRLVTLASWEFSTSAAGRGDFKVLMEDLNRENAAAQPWSADMMLRPPPFDVTSSESAAAGAQRKVSDALQKGYVPLHYTTRLGEASAGWYRGPLLPERLHRQNRDPYPSAESALMYDESTGLFDVSYSVAWQLGRLLALSDRDFGVTLSDWRGQGRSLHDLLEERCELLDQYTTLKQDDVDLEQSLKLLEPGEMSKLITKFLERDVVDRIGDDGLALFGTGPRSELREQFPGLTDALMEELLALPPAEQASWLLEKLPELLGNA